MISIELYNGSVLNFTPLNREPKILVATTTDPVSIEALRVFQTNSAEITKHSSYYDMVREGFGDSDLTDGKTPTPSTPVVQISLTENEAKLFKLWCGWQLGLSNREYKPLFIFQRGKVIETNVLKSFAEEYNHLIISNNNVVVNLNELRSSIIRINGEGTQANLNNAMEFIASKLKHPYPFIETNTPVITIDDSATTYIFCEYQGDGKLPWCKCLLATLVEGVLVYHELRRSEIKPLSSAVIHNTNALGQSVFARRYPELR